MKHKKILTEFMKQKSLWMHDLCKIPCEWYFVEGDEQEIMTWDAATAKSIWEKIKVCILKNEASGLNYRLCPFCYKNNYNHAQTRPGRHNHSCIDCGYGKRHGICTDDESKSEFRKILHQFNKERLNIYKCLANDYYRLAIKKLEETF